MSDKEKLTKAIEELNEETAYQLVQTMLDNGAALEEVVEACREGMEKVGELFQKGEYFLSELIMSGELLKNILEKVVPDTDGESVQSLGTIVIGTVQGDVHNIGKDIVINVLKANGYKVVDLGVDVAPKKFVEEIKEHNPQVVGLSGLLTEAIKPMKDTIDTIKNAGLREQVKVIIGGGVVNEEVRGHVGADNWSNDVSTGLNIIKGWVGGNNG